MLQRYTVLAIILNFSVDFLLLLATNRLFGYPPKPVRAALAASLGTLMTIASFLPGFSFLMNFLWRLISLALMSSAAFGWNMSALRCGLVFILLNMALGGITQGLGGNSLASVAGGTGMLFLLCTFGFRRVIHKKNYLPVELAYGNSRIRILALEDTGNTLMDPVTGQPVLVVGAEVATQLTGLSAQQLRNPVESISTLPGLRLVPYKTINQSGGLLLALKISHVKIGNYEGSSLVAFAPERLDTEGAYQALTGGMV